MPTDPMDPDQFMAQRYGQGDTAPQAPMDPDAFMARRGGSTPQPTSRGGRAGGASGQAERGDTSSPTARFLGGVMDTTVRGIPTALKSAAKVLSGPTGAQEVANDMIVQPAMDQAKKAKDAWNRGERVEAVGHGMAAALPVVGPAAAQAGETIGGELEYDKDGHAIAMTREPDVARGLGQGVGLVAGSVPSLVKPVAEGAARLAGKIPVPERLTPEGMYQSALRPGLGKKNLPKIDAEVNTGIREGIPVSRAGVAKAEGIVDAANRRVTGAITNRSNELGNVVSPREVSGYADEVRPQFDTVDPEADQAAITGVKSRFLKKHSSEAPYTKIAPMTEEGSGYMPVGEGSTTIEKPLTLLEAQAEKQKTYTQLRKKYGELGSADVETQKALARGLKDKIAEYVPEVAPDNKLEGEIYDLLPQLQKTIAREGNKNLIGLIPSIVGTGAGMLAGHGLEGGIAGALGTLAVLAMDNPAIKSRITIALDRARKANLPGKVGMATAAGVTGGASSSNDPIRNQIIPKRPTGLMGEAGPEAIVPLRDRKDSARYSPEPGNPADPYDRGALKIGVPVDAASRFTRTPIKIWNKDEVNRRAASRARADGIQPDADEQPKGNMAEGSYDPSEKSIRINLNGSPSWDEMNSAIHHEDVHALLRKNGIQAHDPKISELSGFQSFLNILSSKPGTDPIISTAQRGFLDSGRGGQMTNELPAYMSAYQEGDLPGVTPELRKKWLDAYMPTLPPEVQSTLRRIIGSNDASQRQPPARTPRFAKGGIIRKKTLGLVGEAGPEAIVPVESLTASQPTVPEAPESIGAQIGQLANLKRRVVMLPKGTFPHQAPEGMAHYADQLGNRYIFNPNLISKNDIRVAVLRNRLPNILGARHGGMGVPDKSLLRGNVVNVVGMSKNGSAVQSTATDGPHMRSAIQQTKRIAPKVRIENPSREINRRLKALA